MSCKAGDETAHLELVFRLYDPWLPGGITRWNYQVGLPGEKPSLPLGGHWPREEWGKGMENTALKFNFPSFLVRWTRPSHLGGVIARRPPITSLVRNVKMEEFKKKCDWGSFLFFVLGRGGGLRVAVSFVLVPRRSSGNYRAMGNVIHVIKRSYGCGWTTIRMFRSQFFLVFFFKSRKKK